MLVEAVFCSSAATTMSTASLRGRRTWQQAIFHPGKALRPCEVQEPSCFSWLHNCATPSGSMQIFKRSQKGLQHQPFRTPAVQANKFANTSTLGAKQQRESHTCALAGMGRGCKGAIYLTNLSWPRLLCRWLRCRRRGLLMAATSRLDDQTPGLFCSWSLVN